MVNPERVERLSTGGGPNLFEKEDAALASGRPTEGKSFENILAFLSEYVVSTDTKTMTPRSGIQTLDQWGRSMRILGQHLGTDKINEEIADELGVTKQNVNLIIKSRIRRLYESASPELKAKYPLESLSSRKPLPIASRRRYSEVRGGLAARAERMASQGKTPAQIKQELGGSRKLGDARQALRGWGINIPLEINPILPALKDLANTDLSDKDIQDLLDKVQNSWQYKVLLKAGLIVNLTSLARRAGLYLRGSDIPRIYEVIKGENLPVGKVSNYVRGEDGERAILGWYYFIAATRGPKASSILKETPELQDLRINPVRVIGVPVKTVPNTTELERSGKYRRVLKLAGEIAGRKLRSNLLNQKNIVAGHVSVSFYTEEVGGGFWYEVEHEDAVRAHLAKRMKELGII